jgi:hypothetical protein
VFRQTRVYHTKLSFCQSEHSNTVVDMLTESPALTESDRDSSSSTPSPTSSSISVVAVPFEVTGDGPTMSLGLGATAGERPPSIEPGRRLLPSRELRAELDLEQYQYVVRMIPGYSDSQGLEPRFL